MLVVLDVYVSSLCYCLLFQLVVVSVWRGRAQVIVCIAEDYCNLLMYLRDACCKENLGLCFFHENSFYRWHWKH